MKKRSAGWLGDPGPAWTLTRRQKQPSSNTSSLRRVQPHGQRSTKAGPWRRLQRRRGCHTASQFDPAPASRGSPPRPRRRTNLHFACSSSGPTALRNLVMMCAAAARSAHLTSRCVLCRTLCFRALATTTARRTSDVDVRVRRARSVAHSHHVRLPRLDRPPELLVRAASPRHTLVRGAGNHRIRRCSARVDRRVISVLDVHAQARRAMGSIVRRVSTDVFSDRR